MRIYKLKSRLSKTNKLNLVTLKPVKERSAVTQNESWSRIPGSAEPDRTWRRPPVLSPVPPVQVIYLFPDFIAPVGSRYSYNYTSKYTFFVVRNFLHLFEPAQSRCSLQNNYPRSLDPQSPCSYHSVLVRTT